MPTARPTSTRPVSRAAETTVPETTRVAAASTNKPQRRHKAGESGRADVFAVPKHLIPKGFSIEWKRMSVLGKDEDASYHVELAEQGWEPASIDQFPTLVPKGVKSGSIVRKGMQLMIRPQELTDEARAEEKAEAREQVKHKLQQLGETEKGSLKRKVTSLKRSYERPPVDDEDGSEE